MFAPSFCCDQLVDAAQNGRLDDVLALVADGADLECKDNVCAIVVFNLNTLDSDYSRALGFNVHAIEFAVWKTYSFCVEFKFGHCTAALMSDSHFSWGRIVSLALALYVRMRILLAVVWMDGADVCRSWGSRRLRVCADRCRRRYEFPRRCMCRSLLSLGRIQSSFHP